MTAPSGAEPTRLVELTRDEVTRRAGKAVAFVPVGACEQHGPHLPLGTDLLVVEHVASAVAARLAGQLDVVVAPSVAVGYSPYHIPLGPTLTSSVDTLRAQLMELCTGLVGAGFGRIFLLNGHGGNAELLVVVAREIGARCRVLTGAGSYWIMAWDELVDAGAQLNGRLPGHAGAFETSLMTAIRPDLVHQPPERPQDFTPNPRGYFKRFHTEDPQDWCDTDGFSDDPSGGDAESGRQYLDAIVSAVAAGLRDFACD